MPEDERASKDRQFYIGQAYMQTEFMERYRDSPQVVPDIGGEAYEEVQRRYNEEWEALFHEHMPHTEVEGEPGPTLVRPNIVIIPE